MASQLLDGCISKQAYQNAPARIVHLLKQGVAKQNPNGYDSLIEFIREMHRQNPDCLAPLWRGCAQRTYCLFNAFPAWQTISKLSPGDLWRAFEQTAVLNVLKKPGTSSTSADQMDREADWTRLLNQISNLRPDIVICGGTFEVWSHRVPDIQVKRSPSGMRYAMVGNAVYLDTYHPSHRTNRRIEYAFFRAGVSEICREYIRDKTASRIRCEGELS